MMIHMDFILGLQLIFLLMKSLGPLTKRSYMVTKCSKKLMKGLQMLVEPLLVSMKGTHMLATTFWMKFLIKFFMSKMMMILPSKNTNLINAILKLKLHKCMSKLTFK